MMNEKTDIPKLRFLGSSSDWETSKAASIFQINAGGDVPKDNVSQEKTGDFQYPIFANASENKGFYGYSEKYKITPPALTIAGRGVYIGIAHLRLEKFYPIVRLLVLKPKHKQKIDLGFFEYAFNNLNIFIESTGVPQLTAPQLSTYVISYPTLPEQQKIATFLTAVDRRIELLKQKKEKLEAYKKGVMQQLFSCQIRFKQDDGSVFPEWEEKKLGEVAKFSKGKGIFKSDISESGELKCIRYGQLYTEYGEVIDQVVSRTECKPSTLILSEANDVIIPSSGETQIDIARAACVLKSGIALGGDLNIIRSPLNGVFLSFYLNNRRKHQIAKMAQGISVVHLYNSQLVHLEIEIPCDEEQGKIVSFLRSLNEITEKLTFQINQTQTWKKGLLQQMFI